MQSLKEDFYCTLLYRITDAWLANTQLYKMPETINIVCLIIIMLSASIHANNTSDEEFLLTLKPLYCHKIRDIEARSQVECAIYCKKDLYSCVGYAFVHDKSHDNCQICYIHDTKDPIKLSPNVSDNSIFVMPVIELQKGKIL